MFFLLLYSYYQQWSFFRANHIEFLLFQNLAGLYLLLSSQLYFASKLRDSVLISLCIHKLFISALIYYATNKKTFDLDFPTIFLVTTFIETAIFTVSSLDYTKELKVYIILSLVTYLLILLSGSFSKRINNIEDEIIKLETDASIREKAAMINEDFIKILKREYPSISVFAYYEKNETIINLIFAGYILTFSISSVIITAIVLVN